MKFLKIILIFSKKKNPRNFLEVLLPEHIIDIGPIVKVEEIYEISIII